MIFLKWFGYIGKLGIYWKNIPHSSPVPPFTNMDQR